MAKSTRPGFLKMSINHGAIFQKERIEKQWNCTPYCNKQNNAPESKNDPEINRELSISH